MKMFTYTNPEGIITCSYLLFQKYSSSGTRERETTSFSNSPNLGPVTTSLKNFLLFYIPQVETDKIRIQNVAEQQPYLDHQVHFLSVFCASSYKLSFIQILMQFSVFSFQSPLISRSLVQAFINTHYYILYTLSKKSPQCFYLYL